MYNQSQENPPKVETVITVCPYCMDEKRGKTSCCGEVHFETAYLVDGEVVLESELSHNKKMN